MTAELKAIRAVLDEEQLRQRCNSSDKYSKLKIISSGIGEGLF